MTVAEALASRDPFAARADGPESVGVSACANCGNGPVVHYCAVCGQRAMTDRDLSVAGFLHQCAAELTSLDGRLWLTLRALVTRPGLLAREYFAGRGERYMRPLTLFLLVNVIFFIIQPHTGLLRYSLDNYVGYDGDVARRREDAVNAVRINHAEARRAVATPAARGAQLRPEAYDLFAERFNAALSNQKKSMLLFSIPVMALAMVPMYARRRRRYVEHLVFSIHTYAFFLFFAGVCITPLFRLVLGAARRLGVPDGRLMSLVAGEAPVIAVLLLVIGGYTWLGLRRMYGDSRHGAALRALAIFGVLQVLIMAYHDLLFYTTLASL